MPLAGSRGRRGGGGGCGGWEAWAGRGLGVGWAWAFKKGIKRRRNASQLNISDLLASIEAAWWRVYIKSPQPTPPFSLEGGGDRLLLLLWATPSPSPLPSASFSRHWSPP